MQFSVRTRFALIKNITNGFNDGQVGRLVFATNIVTGAIRARGQYQMNGAAVILHMQPVTDVQAVAVERQRQAVDRARRR